MNMDEMCLGPACSVWQWVAGQRQASHGLSWVWSGSGSVEVALAFAVEFKTSPKSPPAGLVPPTFDFKSSSKRKRRHETQT